MSMGAALRLLGLNPRKELAAGRPANGEAARHVANEEKPMEDDPKAGDSADKEKDQKPADPAAPEDKPADKPADPPKEDAAVAAAEARLRSIVELCTLAGKPGSALGFIDAKASVEDVRAKLAKAKADAVDRNPVDGTPPAQSSAPRIDVAAIYAARNKGPA